MNCGYCGNSYVTAEAHCEGCGSPKVASPASESDQLFMHIGRCVLAHRSGELAGRFSHQNSEPKDDHKKWVRRTVKAGVCLLVLLVLVYLPNVFLPLFMLGLMFGIWFYLPYLGIRALVKWIAT